MMSTVKSHLPGQWGLQERAQTARENEADLLADSLGAAAESLGVNPGSIHTGSLRCDCRSCKCTFNYSVRALKVVQPQQHGPQCGVAVQASQWVLPPVKILCCNG